MSAIACSAVAFVSTPGVFDTTIPRRGSVEVDVVENHGVVGDDAQLGPRRVEERLVHGNCGRGDDSLGSTRSVDELEGGGELLLDLGGHPGRLVHPRARHG